MTATNDQDATRYASPEALADTDALLRVLASSGTKPEDAPEGLLLAVLQIRGER